MADEAEKDEREDEEESSDEVTEEGATDDEEISDDEEQEQDEHEDASSEADEEDADSDQDEDAQPTPEVQDDQDDHDGGGSHSEGEGEDEFEESVVHVNRCCKVVQGGKQFSFSALVVAGNRNGKISYGFGKANQVPQAIEKAIDDSRKRVIEVPIVHGTTPHRVELEYCSTKLMLRPASPGTGVIAALPVRTTVNLAGITDLLTKVYGSTNPINCVKAVYEGLKSLRTKEEIESLRGVKIQ
jgi:small subunit ribosomal protein S5